MHVFSRTITAVFFLCLGLFARAQKDTSSLLASIDDKEAEAKIPVKRTFNGTYILNTASIENVGKGVLQVLIMHRFGKISDGIYEFFGLDNATIRLGLDYGITDRLMVSVGRSSYEKAYDASVKYRLLNQLPGAGHPLSLGLNAGMVYTTLKYPDKPYMTGKYRTDYFTQLLIARKFNSNLSLQLTPSWLHYNLVPDTADKNDVFALGLGGRIKITKRLSISAEYNYLFKNQVVTNKVYNSLSTGLDIETGGHTFQLIFTNSRGMVPPAFLAKTADSWADGDIYFGFNISRVFTIGKSAKKTW